jgi:cytochrome c
VIRVVSSCLLLVLVLAPAARAAGDPELGRRIFGRCGFCHALDPDRRGMVGPTLHGVLGRKAGTLDGFKYSEAMRDAGLVWSEETLRRYITNPQDVVPDNRMVFPGIRNQKEVDDLVAYLKEATR